MIRSSGPDRADRLTGKVLSALLLLLVVSILPVSAPLVVQTTGTPRVIQTTTPVPSPVGTVQTVNTPLATPTTIPVPTPAATLQTTQTLRPQATMTTVRMTTAATPAPTATTVPASPVMTIRQTYTPVMTGSPFIRETTTPPTGMATGAPQTTGLVSGTAGTPRVIETPTDVGGFGGTGPTFYGTVSQGTSGGPGTGLSSAGESPELAAAIAGSFNQSRMHQASLQDVYLTSVGTSLASGSGAIAASGGAGLYDADVTTVKKGDLMNNCPDDTIHISLHGMDPASPVAGQIVTGGSQLVFGDPSIRTVEIGNGEMKIASLRRAKLFGLVDLEYTEVSTITPAGMKKIDKPFWTALASEQPWTSSPRGGLCAGQTMGRQDSGMTTGLTPGITPTPTPEYGVNEVDQPCPVDPDCYPEAAARCYAECTEQFPVSTEDQRLENETVCKRASYAFDLNCCISKCLGVRDQAEAVSFCNSKCLFELAISITKGLEEQHTKNVGRISRI